MSENAKKPSPIDSAPLSIGILQIAQAQMALERYEFGAPVRVTERGFKNLGNGVVAEIELQNEHGVFDGGPKGGFMVAFYPNSYDIQDVRAMVNGRQIGHMEEAELQGFDYRLHEGVERLDMEGVQFIENWLEAHDNAKGYLRGTRIGDSKAVHFGERNDPVIDADAAIQYAISEQIGGMSLLITGQRTDKLREAIASRRTALEAAMQHMAKAPRPCP
jgi:hypothetical protein